MSIWSVALRRRIGVRCTTSLSPVAYYSLFPATFPNGPPPHASFHINPRALRDEYIKLQAINHPDRASAPGRSAAERTSAVINEAYEKLLDPYARALHLLSLHGIEIKEEVVEEAEGDLLMRVMEAREALEEAQTKEDVVVMQEQNEERVHRVEGGIADAFAGEDYARARGLVPELRYWLNIRSALREWEPGVEPVVHH